MLSLNNSDYLRIYWCTFEIKLFHVPAHVQSWPLNIYFKVILIKNANGNKLNDFHGSSLFWIIQHARSGSEFQ